MLYHGSLDWEESVGEGISTLHQYYVGDTIWPWSLIRF